MNQEMKKILIIQTAFIGDVILATPVVEKLHQHFPDADIDFLLRKGNENLLEAHPYLHSLLIWDKKKNKYKSLWNLLLKIRKEKYDLIVNLQRFFSSGFLTAFSGARVTAGFKKNPLSFLFSNSVQHTINSSGPFIHEARRNLTLVTKWTDNHFVYPKIYLTPSDSVKLNYQGKYITLSPASVWFTKQYPADRWIDFMNRVGGEVRIFLLGGKADHPLCSFLQQKSTHPDIKILAGQLSLRESAALMRNAVMNYSNDSAPLHLASAVNAPVTAVFCSTVPQFGFTPLSDISHIAETKIPLPCRPCGLHGKNHCPQGHFKCADIETSQLLSKLPLMK